MMRVLIGCEMSGITRDAFRCAGHEAMSCDLLPSERPGPHYQGNVLDVLDDNWDLAIFHPDCTYLTNAGARWYWHPEDSCLPTEQRRPHPQYPDRRQRQEESILFFGALQRSRIPRICIENPQPLGFVMDRVGRYTQKIQPWQFGEPFSKGLCLWIKGLPKLVPTKVMPAEQREQACWLMAPGEDRKKERSRSFAGVAMGMAIQWGSGV